MIIPLLADGTVVMERQWRYPLGRAFIEFTAGKIDEGEAPLVNSDRELRKETGYVAERFIFIATINNVISYSDEHIDLYLAEGPTAGEAALEDGAFWLEKILTGAWS